MSLAGPYGEAACRYCNTLVDLREDRRLVRHNVGGNRARCRGSLSYAHTQKEKEVESLAFSSDPVELPHLQPEQEDGLEVYRLSLGGHAPIIEDA